LADADRLCDKAAVLGETIKGTLHLTVMDIVVSGFSVNSLTSSRVRHVVVIDLWTFKITILF